MHYKSIKVGQLNCGRSKAVTLELGAIRERLKLNILLIQEPYSQNCIVSGFGGDCSVFFFHNPDPSQSNLHPIPPMTAIVVFPKSIKCTLLANISSAHIICVALDLPVTICKFQHITFVSQYYQFSDNINIHLDSLQHALDFIPDGPLIIGADINARSTYWGPGPSNTRGQAAENFINSNELFVLNEPDSRASFNGPMGSSHIDVTLASDSVVDACSGWTVRESISCSDHRLITLEVNFDNKAPAVLSALGRPFRKFVKSYETFENDLFSNLDHIASAFDPQADPDNSARLLQEAIVRAAETGIGRVSAFPCQGRRPVTWWNSNLNRLKRLSRAARAALRIARRRDFDENRKTVLLDRFRAADQEYKRAIVKAKQDSWRQFILAQSSRGPWGPAYKAITLGARGLKVACGIKNPETTRFSSSLKENGEFFIDHLIRKDLPEQDTPAQGVIRRELRSVYNSDRNSSPLALQELEDIFKNLCLWKAPGLDRITSLLARHSWKVAKHEIFQLFKACLEGGIFPDCWKAGLLIVIPKSGSNKPLTHPNAYRPITLLPVLGKCLERIIASRLQKVLEFSPNQFGFLPGRSTEDNIHFIVSATKSSINKYVIAVFLDITGAFDNAWWPLILQCLRECNIPKNLFYIICNYFENREIYFDCGSTLLSRPASIGCPQGSVLGPLLWNVVMDTLLRLNLPEGCRLLAYADDATLIVEGDTQSELLLRANSALRLINDWGLSSRLSFSPQKTEAIFLKGKLQRPPRLRFNDFLIPYRPKILHLGVLLNKNFKFNDHVRYILDRARVSFYRVSRLAGRHWGLKFGHLKCMYVAIFVSIVSYAASVWNGKFSGVVRLALLRGQRAPLLLLTRSYRTTSNSALPVVAGVLPLDLQVQMRAAGYCFRKNRELIVGDVPIRRGEDETFEVFKKRALEKAMDVWQERWDVAVTGRHTYSFFPDIRQRLSYTWVVPDHFVSQYLTGHGAFAAKLTKLGLRNDPHCACGEIQDPDHILWSCSLADNERKDMFSGFPDRLPTSNIDLVSSKFAFRAFCTFAKRVSSRKDIFR